MWRKRRRFRPTLEALNLKKLRVVTTGGIFGKISTINDDKVVTLEVANNVRIRVTSRPTSTPERVLSFTGAATGRTSRTRCSRRSLRRSHLVSPMRRQ